MLAGVLAGMLAFGFAWVVGEPQVDLAIGYENQRHQMLGQAPEPELVSREVQSTIGLATGIVVYGCALGGIFSLVFAYAHGRIGSLSPRGTAAVLSAIGFVALILVPQLKYPANPPSVGDPATIGSRTGLYFAMITLSVLGAVATASTRRQLARRLGNWNSVLLACAAYVVVIAAGMAILPAVNEVRADFSATILWRFRLASLGIEAVLWTALALVFGVCAERQFAPERSHGLRAWQSLR